MIQKRNNKEFNFNKKLKKKFNKSNQKSKNFKIKITLKI